MEKIAIINELRDFKIKLNKKETESSGKQIALIQAILCMESEPVNEAELSHISKLSPEIVNEALKRLDERYGMANSGVRLSHTAVGVMLSPKEEYWEHLKDSNRKDNERNISRAEIETLSIIAYLQPATKAEIKKFRTVSPDNMIHLLLEKNMIEEVGKKDIPGKPVQYGTAKEFLKIFGLSSIKELPKRKKLLRELAAKRLKAF
jgi:segregation and condensation protein B